jgi:hypothetical protein
LIRTSSKAQFHPQALLSRVLLILLNEPTSHSARLYMVKARKDPSHQLQATNFRHTNPPRKNQQRNLAKHPT